MLRHDIDDLELTRYMVDSLLVAFQRETGRVHGPAPTLRAMTSRGLVLRHVEVHRLGGEVATYWLSNKGRAVGEYLALHPEETEDRRWGRYQPQRMAAIPLDVPSKQPQEHRPVVPMDPSRRSYCACGWEPTSDRSLFDHLESEGVTRLLAS